ncbi:hypothetical protein FPOAC1_007426 [Fusarium poae]|uniref:Uncharacterized protein n=1 Tax=Fusarium poae TaxID=36050 RepID=A0A1B8ARN4_FUSPO|nr:hypothetical protein FPOAC1_007426 [Fusarium poae]KAG8668063.1 hypothetical protein FPOAC1_007426 [Fusarium poae]OBS23001.1 hypothetical protein FPOA_09320 [Fusarium poae]
MAHGEVPSVKSPDEPQHLEAMDLAEDEKTVGSNDVQSCWTPDEERLALRSESLIVVSLFELPLLFQWQMDVLILDKRIRSLDLVSYVDRGDIGNVYTAGLGKE